MPRRRYAYDGLELTQESQNSSEFWSWARLQMSAQRYEREQQATGEEALRRRAEPNLRRSQVEEQW